MDQETINDRLASLAERQTKTLDRQTKLLGRLFGQIEREYAQVAAVELNVPYRDPLPPNHHRCPKCAEPVPDGEWHVQCPPVAEDLSEENQKISRPNEGNDERTEPQ